MAIFPIRTFGDPVLRTPAKAVEDVDDKIRKLIEDMSETMYEAPGVGLAAPQIGVGLRVAVFDTGDGLGARTMINPEILETEGEWEFEEGCLSVPGYWWSITRPAYVEIRALDENGEEVVYEGDELMGRVLQHEYQHLDGVIIIDQLGRRERKKVLKELSEQALGL
ncbi:MAG TPA: peptide deformylase [Acidimicrobiia bacterium]|nr:peptide deformylase [Acidimicrobiia bacterium]